METLNKKLAGIPVKYWVVLVIVAIALGLYLRKRSAAQGGSAGDLTAYDTGTYSDGSYPIPGSAGGGNGGGGVGATAQDNSAVLGAISDLGTSLTGAIASIPIPLTEPSPPLPPAQAPPAPAVTLAVPPPAGPVASTGPQAAPPATVVTPPTAPAGPVPGASFTWTFAAIGGLPAHSIWYASDKPLFMQHLQKRSLSYANWKANHRSAACRVFGDCS